MKSKINKEEELNSIIQASSKKLVFQDLPYDLIKLCFEFLTEGEILKQLLTNKLFNDIINNSPGIFRNCKELILDLKWAYMHVEQRQFFLSQMEKLEMLRVCSECFCEDGLIIQEVAALIYKNRKSLKILKLLSPDNPLKDDTPLHDPFSFYPDIFTELIQLQVCGSQALEWFHILGNCSTPKVIKLEVSHFSLQADHWSWNVIYDFTSLGIAGLHRLLDTMGKLEKLTIGFDIWFESSTDQPPEEARSLRTTAARGIRSFLNNVSTRNSENTNYEIGQISNTNTNYISNENIEYPDEVESRAIEMAWSERGIFRSYKGKLSEEDFGDIFAISFIRTANTGSLKRINLKYRVSEGNEFEDEEGINPISEFFQGTSFFCRRFLSDVVRNFPSNIFF